MAGAAVEANVVKGIGTAGKVIGSFIGSILLVKEGNVDEWLIEGGTRLKQTSQSMRKRASQRLEVISDAGTDTFVERFEKINWIYNNTTNICFDDEHIYLISGQLQSKISQTKKVEILEKEALMKYNMYLLIRASFWQKGVVSG